MLCRSLVKLLLQMKLVRDPLFSWITDKLHAAASSLGLPASTSTLPELSSLSRKPASQATQANRGPIQDTARARIRITNAYNAK